ENTPMVFEGRLHPFIGTNGDQALYLPDIAGLPKGTWHVFLLRAPAGSDPLEMDPSQWILGHASFENEKL
ncbi:MAG: hypothetical protein HQK66_13835, partial [Desulfamplus sp.]|nr:hypothetical protein [Desulfamplus sp.]